MTRCCALPWSERVVVAWARACRSGLRTPGPSVQESDRSRKASCAVGYAAALETIKPRG